MGTPVGDTVWGGTRCPRPGAVILPCDAHGNLCPPPPPGHCGDKQHRVPFVPTPHTGPIVGAHGGRPCMRVGAVRPGVPLPSGTGGGTVVQMGSIKVCVPPPWCCVDASTPFGGRGGGGGRTDFNGVAFLLLPPLNIPTSENQSFPYSNFFNPPPPPPKPTQNRAANPDHGGILGPKAPNPQR